MAREMLIFQGIPVEGIENMDISDARIADMAGNAFCTASCLPIQLLCMFLLSWVSRREHAGDISSGGSPPSSGIWNRRQRSSDEIGPDWGAALLPKRLRRTAST